MKPYWLVTLAALAWSPAVAETYLCVEQSSGGLKFVEGEWRGVQFKASAQFVLTSKDGIEYQAKRIGDNYAMHRCTRAAYDGVPSEQMVCGGIGLGLIFDFDKLRFTEVHTFGYIEDDRTGDNTPYVTGGQCTEIQ